MTENPLGQCHICKKTIYRKDIAGKSALYYELWPGDGFLCSSHPGVVEEYKLALIAEKRKLREKLEERRDAAAREQVEVLDPQDVDMLRAEVGDTDKQEAPE
jgi:hypothetical protein